MMTRTGREWVDNGPAPAYSGVAGFVHRGEIGGRASLTPRKLQILDEVRACNGNRSRAARNLGVCVQTVQWAMRDARRAGATVPLARNGRRGYPDLRPRRRTSHAS